MPAGLAEWPLVVAVLAALVAGSGVLVAGLTLGHRIVTQLLSRIDAVAANLTAAIDTRFAAAEERRQSATDIWLERLRVRDEAIARVTADLARAETAHPQIAGRIDALAAEMASNYVSRQTWMEHVGGVSIKLDKLKDELDRLSARLESTR